ncbi:damage-inducible protein DinB [Chitinophaga lutea]|uniref:Damage-inducible protein DinB n=1 Tax=Chitinophaga lutea TaxID=2488634 RepID=A0A3N4PMB3_9BACT|nr:DinB family protein [Chitinophaga lutea]RPE08935.1 damage-inducible protein DinB [Chitinophaga lutea]
MKIFFTELFEYNHDCNQKLVDLLTGNADKTSEKTIKLYSHILNAHQIWNNRIEPREPAFGIWQVHAIGDWRNIEQANHEHTMQIVDKLDLDSEIQYTIGKVNRFSKSVRHLLFHVINHSTYHRGQIATECRQSGLDPLATDYILYERK